MCGDMVTRRGTIVEAVANGRTAAEAAHQYLSGLVDGQEGET
jgi:NADPH-dependent glutamate synthase beta subunit-like oxidoreductase